LLHPGERHLVVRSIRLDGRPFELSDEIAALARLVLDHDLQIVKFIFHLGALIGARQLERLLLAALPAYRELGGDHPVAERERRDGEAAPTEDRAETAAAFFLFRRRLVHLCSPRSSRRSPGSAPATPRRGASPALAGCRFNRPVGYNPARRRLEGS